MSAVRLIHISIALLFLFCIAKMQAAAENEFLQLEPKEPAEMETEPTDSFAYDLSSYAYFVPDDQNYVSAIFTADRNWLHLEGRYNYEDIDSGSAWVGYNFSIGSKIVFDATPMLGGVFGSLHGIAPGWELTLSFWKIEIYSENEYVFDLDDSTGNFFYNWSEVTYSPLDWLQVGIVLQRTKAYETDLDVQRGLLAGFSYKILNFTAYVFNPGWDKPTVSLAAGVSF
jgi:hypothetical protein